MKVLLVLILIVGAFCLGAWTDHVFYIPLGSSPSPASLDTTPTPQAAQPQYQPPQQQQQAGQAQAPAPATSSAPDLRSCLAEARSRHLEADYAQRMCREIVND
ncbi:MAG: hypothetical protein JO264_06090 [Acidisphaera sp.]|nr:hypothetical protein [Acidisphaera sp.]